MAQTWERVNVELVAHRKHRPLAARNALRVTALLAAAHGVVLIVSPDRGLSLFGASPVATAAPWLRSSGVLFVALAVVFWSASRWPASMMQRPVLLSAGIVTGALALAGVLPILDGTVQSTFASVVGIETALAVWIWWLLLSDGI
ncbi:MAG: hypothetical protein A2Z12_07650 [Actinobacteria bacterium RBG_16_68_21]|nr:MAG: hypothetical protein A2Z12_07650 [Actinobacteria bacterium RBG_16_68_21]